MGAYFRADLDLQHRCTGTPEHHSFQAASEWRELPQPNIRQHAKIKYEAYTGQTVKQNLFWHEFLKVKTVLKYVDLKSLN